jgi:hypothetical protein
MKRIVVMLAMRAVILIILGVRLGVCQSNQPSIAATAPFSVHISTPQQVVKAGSQIRLDIQTRNLTQHAMMWEVVQSPGPGRAEFLFQPIVHDPRGNLALTKLEERNLKGHLREGEDLSTNFSTVPVPLPAGETANNVMLLSDIYDLSRPGDYTVMIEKSVSQAAASPTLVKSNTITITVTP